MFIDLDSDDEDSGIKCMPINPSPLWRCGRQIGAMKLRDGIAHQVVDCNPNIDTMSVMPWI